MPPDRSRAGVNRDLTREFRDKVRKSLPDNLATTEAVATAVAAAAPVAASESEAGLVELAEDGESESGLAVQADDARLADAREPLEHEHDDLRRDFRLLLRAWLLLGLPPPSGLQHEFEPALSSE